MATQPASSASSPARAVWFPRWAEVLAQEDLAIETRERYRVALLQYLRFCKESRQRATVASARAFMQQIEGQRRLGVSQLATWKAARNWFFQAGARRPPALGKTPSPAAPSRASLFRSKVPPLAATDLGGPAWERRLIRALRRRHYQWRTEQAYRMGAGRFAAWLAAQRRGRTVLTAEEVDLRDFLSDLAAHQRVAVATQRQALNALGFLLREALGRTLADFGGFTPARRPKRIPVVRSRVECQRLFAALDGTSRLMAELMYGSGLRLMELLRLRIKDVDLERRQLVVREGKGG